MAWIKRNLFFFIGGLVALGLLGAAAYYNYTSWSRNTDAMAALTETYATLKTFSDPNSSPGNEKVPRIQEAKDQEALAAKWLGQVKVYFQPIAPVPTDNPVTSETFAAALRRTIDSLQHEAEASHVGLPPEYGFSFEAERSRVTFSAGLDLLAVQLGEVKTITEILYAAGVNDFDGIQRTRASDDDTTGPQSDYIGELPTTSGPATVAPYVVTFRSFGPEIAQVFSGFASSPHGFVVKSINVQPAGADNSEAAVAPMNPGPGPGFSRFPGVPQPNQPPERGLVTVLKEKLLRVSMEIEIVKLPPRNKPKPMDFIKKHYEKVILSLVLLGVVGALVALPFVIAKDKADMEAMADIVTPRPKDLPPLDLSAENNILARMQTPYELDLSTTNKLFNPVTWKKNEAGDLIKITSGHEIDAEAAVVTNITPLYFILSLETVETNVGFRYVIGVQREGSRTHATQHQTRVASVGEKEDFFTITQVKGDPAAPDELLLKLPETGEVVSVSKAKPFKRPEDYIADLRFDPERMSFHKQRVGMQLEFGGDVYNIVAIHQDEVILLAQSNQKKTILHFSR